MTENEREEMLKDIRDGYIEEWDNLSIDELFEEIKKEHEEIQQYREIGTVEEFKALKEKSVAKKPLRVPTDDTCLYYESRCPSCGAWLSKEIKRTHCRCNQKLDWQ